MTNIADIKILDTLDVLWITYKREWANEYVLAFWWGFARWRKVNTHKNKVFDNAGKGRASWYPLQFIMWYNNCSKEEAIQFMKEKLYLDNINKKYGTKTIIKFF